jgi:hypothetical protein
LEEEAAFEAFFIISRKVAVIVEALALYVATEAELEKHELHLNGKTPNCGLTQPKTILISSPLIYSRKPCLLVAIIKFIHSNK